MIYLCLPRTQLKLDSRVLPVAASSATRSPMTVVVLMSATVNLGVGFKVKAKSLDGSDPIEHLNAAGRAGWALGAVVEAAWTTRWLPSTC
jgi:phosphoribosylaminoimidazole (AIR) synthetase